MDLLGSILSSMDKPPESSEKEKELKKKQKADLEKQRLHEKQELLRFRKYSEDRIDRFVKDGNRKSLQFQPLNKFYRTVIHDVAEIAGLMAMSFGTEDIDRYTMIYKKDFAPSEDEIEARRNGDDWNAEKAKEYAEKRLLAKQQEEDVSYTEKPTKVTPTSNYKDKYVHLIGQDAALKAARKTESNISYGFVPSKNKKDVRTIENIQADIQAKKRLKLAQSSETDNKTDPVAKTD